MNEKAPQNARIADVVRAVGREVADLGRLACDLQAVLSPLEPARRQASQAVEAFQSLDLLTQRLQGVATFLEAFAPSLSPSWMGDAAAAARGVTLSDLAQRLARPCNGAPVTKTKELEASFELF